MRNATAGRLLVEVAGPAIPADTGFILGKGVLGTDAVCFYHTERLNSVVAMSVQSTGALAESYAYSPFGKVQRTGANPPPNPFLFTGRRYDDESGLYYYRNRMYDPVQGRFLEIDPIAYAGGQNLYGYVANSPTTFNDPFGLAPPPGCTPGPLCDEIIVREPRPRGSTVPGRSSPTVAPPLLAAAIVSLDGLKVALNRLQHEIEKARLRRKYEEQGCTVIPEVTFEDPGSGVGSRVDLLVQDPRSSVIRYVEVKTTRSGASPRLNRNQLIIRSSIAVGDAISRSPRSAAVGILPGISLEDQGILGTNREPECIKVDVSK